MSIDEAIKMNSQCGGSNGFQEYFTQNGFAKISTRDLDKFIESSGTQVFGWPYFMEIYLAKKAEETAKTMQNWTIAVGIMTGIMFLLAIVNTYMTYLQLIK